MNDNERNELAAIRADLERLRRQHLASTRTIEALADRLRILEWKEREEVTQKKPEPPPGARVETPKPAVTTVFPAAPPVIRAMPQQAPPFESHKAAPVEPPTPPRPVEPEMPETPEPPKVPWEIRLGTYWVPRIGIVMMLTALVFTAYYYHGRLSPSLKAVAMYALCAVGIGLGAWAERKYEILGRALFAGGLAGTYFVTYALHYVAALRLIDSALLCGVLLLCIVAAIVGLAQWRNRPLLAGMAILLGFYTSAISDVSSFTLVSNCLLAGGALYLMLVSGWAPLTGVAFIGTYGTYIIWLLRSGEDTTVRFKLWFVLLYWGLFTLAVFAARRDLVPMAVRNVFASLNNLLGFMFLTLALVTHHLAGNHWKLCALFGGVLVGLAWVAKRQFNDDNSTFSTYLITGLGLLTLAIVEKFSGYETIAALAVEGALLLILGHTLRQPIFRWFGLAAQALCVGWIAANCLDDRHANMRDEIATWFAVAIGFGLVFVQHRQTRPEHGPLREDESERAMSGILQLLANVALAFATWEFVRDSWRPMAYAFEAMAIAWVGHAVKLPIFRWCGAGFQVLSVILLVVHLMQGTAERGRELASWLSVAFGYAVALLQQWRTRDAGGPLRDDSDELMLANLVSTVANVALLVVTWDFVEPTWRIPALAVEGAVLLAIGHVVGSSVHRWSGGCFQVLCVLLMINRYDKVSFHETQRAIATWLAVIVSYAAALVQHWHTRREGGKLRDDEGEKHLASGLAFLASIALLLFNWDFVREDWRATAVAFQSALIAAIAARAKAGRLVLSSQLMLITAYASFVGGIGNHWDNPAPLHLPVTLVVVSLGIAWFTERKLSPGNPYASSIGKALLVYLCAAVAVVILSLSQRLDAGWHFWTMMATAVIAQAIGLIWRNPAWRWIAIATASTTVALFITNEVDHDIDWDVRAIVASHFMGLALLIGLERLIKRSWPEGEEKETRTAILAGAVIALAYLLLHVLWRAANREYLTAVWTVGAFVVFGLGLLVKERAYRFAGLALIGVSVGRAVLYDFWQIQEPLYRILSFVALGVILLVLGYLYAKFREKIMRWL